MLLMILLVLLAPLLLGGVGVPPAGAASAASRTAAVAVAAAPASYAINTDDTNARSGPGTKHPVKGKFDRGDRVRILCTVINDQRQLWDKVSPGNVFVLDKFVSTGRHTAVMPACDGTSGTRPPEPRKPDGVRRVQWRHEDPWLNKANTRLAAEDRRAESILCNELAANIPDKGLGVAKAAAGVCRAGYEVWRNKAIDAVNTNQCVWLDIRYQSVGWGSWKHNVPIFAWPGLYNDDFCRFG
jgi:hypothetical protein